MNKLPPELHEILKNLSSQQQRLFSCDCAAHVLPYFERFQPLDKRPRTAIEVAHNYALGKASQAELEIASEDAECAAWEAGDATWLMTQLGDTFSLFGFEATAAAAATAEGCSAVNLESSIETTVNTAIEVVVTAAVGIQVANAIWSNDWETLPESVLQHYRDVEAQERAWQLALARRYFALNSKIQ